MSCGFRPLLRRSCSSSADACGRSSWSKRWQPPRRACSRHSCCVRPRPTLRYAFMAPRRTGIGRCDRLLRGAVVPPPLGVALSPTRSTGAVAQPQDAADRRSTAGHHRVGTEPPGAESLARSMSGGHRAGVARCPALRLPAPRLPIRGCDLCWHARPHSSCLPHFWQRSFPPPRATLGLGSSGRGAIRHDIRLPRLSRCRLKSSSPTAKHSLSSLRSRMIRCGGRRGRRPS